MKDKDLLLLVIVAAGAWYLYTRSRGLTLTGAVDNAVPMLQSQWLRPDPMSTVTPSGTTSAAAANVFSAIGRAVQSITSALAGPGNTAGAPAQSFAIPGGLAVGAPASNAGVTNVGDVGQPFDPSLAEASPYWMWDFGWERPVNTGVPSLDWTLQ